MAPEVEPFWPELLAVVDAFTAFFAWAGGTHPAGAESAASDAVLGAFEAR